MTAQTQSAITERYSSLANALTHGEAARERQILAPQFRDRAHIVLGRYAYDPLTVLVRHMSLEGDTIVVRARYIGVHGKVETTLDRWLLLGGTWRLAERDPARR